MIWGGESGWVREGVIREPWVGQACHGDEFFILVALRRRWHVDKKVAGEGGSGWGKWLRGGGKLFGSSLVGSPLCPCNGTSQLDSLRRLCSHETS